MSYASGLALGLCAGKKFHEFFRASQAVSSAAKKTLQTIDTARDCTVTGTYGLTLVHALPGRRRYRSNALLGNETLAKALTTLFSTLKGVTSISINTRTGSLLCLYSCPDSHLDLAIRYIHSNYFAPKQNSPAPNPISETMHSLRAFFHWLDQNVRRLSQNQFCLRSLLAAIFISRGLRKVLTLRQYPSGPQMLWWAFGLLRGWAVK